MNTILPLRETVDACEKQLLEDALKAEGTDRERAAALGIALRTFYYRLRFHGLRGRDPLPRRGAGAVAQEIAAP